MTVPAAAKTSANKPGAAKPGAPSLQGEVAKGSETLSPAEDFKALTQQLTDLKGQAAQVRAKIQAEPPGLSDAEVVEAAIAAGALP